MCAAMRGQPTTYYVDFHQGIDWFDAAVTSCEWRGPRLKDVLDEPESYWTTFIERMLM